MAVPEILTKMSNKCPVLQVRIHYSKQNAKKRKVESNQTEME